MCFQTWWIKLLNLVKVEIKSWKLESRKKVIWAFSWYFCHTRQLNMGQERISMYNFSCFFLRSTSERNTIRDETKKFAQTFQWEKKNSSRFIFYIANSWRNVSCHKKLIQHGFKGNKMNEDAFNMCWDKKHSEERETHNQSRICF
jgi:hypothetical protein